ncbi:molybdate ABC transporter substrate-binding protein [bacterium]|nr:molybdate ABC transporter substrate-binding protein [bacterium]
MWNGRVRSFFPLALAVVVALSAAGCGGAKKEPLRLNVACAASLTDVMEAAGKAYAAKTGVQVECEFGSSGALARKVAGDAPFDLFVSANLQWLKFLEDNGRVDSGAGVRVALNTLVCVVPAEAKAVPRSAAELAGLDRVALGDPEHVPAGIYARQALQYSAVWDSLQNNNRLVLSQDVRAVLALVEQGAVDAGIVYATDARMSGRVRLAFTFPEASHDPVDYYAAVVTTSGHAAEAARLLEFMQGAEFRDILTGYGFSLP